MKNLFLYTFSITLTLTLSAGIPLNKKGIGTRGTGGFGTRGTGVGTRGTNLDFETNGFGTRGTDKSESAYTPRQMIALNAKLPYKDLFNNKAFVLKSILAKYLSSSVAAFENSPLTSSLSPMSFKDWSALNAGSLLEKFDKVTWQIDTDLEISNERLVFDLDTENSIIEITSSSTGISQNLKPGMITKTLCEFFRYADSPFPEAEIYYEIMPYEKDIVQSSNANIYLD